MLFRSFPGSLCPNSPSDIFSGIGKNGQLVSICKSKGLVMVRMGNNPNSGEVPFVLLDSIWSKLNAAMCVSTGLGTANNKTSITVYPNPANDVLYIHGNDYLGYNGTVSTAEGKEIIEFKDATSVDISNLPKGMYFLMIDTSVGKQVVRFVKQ